MEDRELVIAVLQAVGMAAAAGESFGPVEQEELAAELDVSAEMLGEVCSGTYAMGLALLTVEGAEPIGHPLLMKAGAQFLARDGEVSRSVLGFLPRYVDDLDARHALLAAGSVLIDEFALAITEDRAVEFAQDIVPEAFEEAVTPRLAVDLFAAAAALLARLAADAPAGCVAEEVIAVELIGRAEVWLEVVDDLSERDFANAKHELRGIYELFEDDDVLELFDMQEPADAAVAGHSPIHRQMGMADQRLEAWFKPLWGTPVTGHLDDAGDDSGGDDEVG